MGKPKSWRRQPKTPPPPAPSTEWLSTEEAAALLDVKPVTLRVGRQKGDIGGRMISPPWHKFGRLVKYHRADIEAYRAARRFDFSHTRIDPTTRRRTAPIKVQG
jgi:hypothetical protein